MCCDWLRQHSERLFGCPKEVNLCFAELPEPPHVTMGYLRRLFQGASPSLNAFDDFDVFLTMWTRHKLSVALPIHVSTKTLRHLPLALRFHLNHFFDNPQYLSTTILFLNQVLLFFAFLHTRVLHALVRTLQLVSTHFRTKISANTSLYEKTSFSQSLLDSCFLLWFDSVLTLPILNVSVSADCL